MFRAVLFTQWKWSRVALALGVVVAFGLPLLSVQGAGWPGLTRYEAIWVLESVDRWSIWYPSLAAMLGLVMATAGWAADHRGRHVYALSLPLPRPQFALMRFGAGAVLLAAPLAALWIGAMLASAATELPPGLRSYPHALALRFTLAVVLSYSVFSAISAGTPRTAGYVLAVLGLVLWLQVMLAVTGSEVRLLDLVFDRFTIWPGAFEVFTGRWTLVDV